MDFQSIALPTELWYLLSGCKDNIFFIFTTKKGNIIAINFNCVVNRIYTSVYVMYYYFILPSEDLMNTFFREIIFGI